MSLFFPATRWRIILMATLVHADQGREVFYSSRIDGLLLAE